MNNCFFINWKYNQSKRVLFGAYFETINLSRQQKVFYNNNIIFCSIISFVSNPLLLYLCKHATWHQYPYLTLGSSPQGHCEVLVILAMVHTVSPPWREEAQSTSSITCGPRGVHMFFLGQQAKPMLWLAEAMVRQRGQSLMVYLWRKRKH